MLVSIPPKWLSSEADLEQDFNHEDRQSTSTDEAIFLCINGDSCELVRQLEPNVIAEKSLLV